MQAKADPGAPPNLYAYAKDIGNEEAAQLLASMGSDATVYEPWKAKKPKPVVLPGIL
ncbi:hypothetical protein [Variovorax paradoxus]|uniref:hypothetical protein n=1 Tax=Variovorax paradoxus TaxID=34073 RepID=UPI000A924FC5|nr:hypothetical protein [Variovorax paradoxus]